MQKIERILVAVDFSSGGHASLDYAWLFAERFGAAIHLVHVWQPITVLAGSAGLDRSGARHALDALVGQTSERGVPVSSEIVEGSPSTAILEVASSGHYDLIVMGTHGRVGLERLLLGSVAEHVVREAPCPVTTVRPQP
jgi:nucleotide-binding universal stress UspA family protein